MFSHNIQLALTLRSLTRGHTYSLVPSTLSVYLTGYLPHSLPISRSPHLHHPRSFHPKYPGIHYPDLTRASHWLSLYSHFLFTPDMLARITNSHGNREQPPDSGPRNIYRVIRILGISPKDYQNAREGISDQTIQVPGPRSLVFSGILHIYT